jgi:hypothetical protein
MNSGRFKVKLASYVATADLSLSLVMQNPTLWPNLANKFFGTLAAKTAVGVNHWGWQADVIRGNDAGLVLDPVDLEKASHDLVAFLADGDHVACCGANARRLAEERYSRDHLTDLLEDVLRSALGTSRSWVGPRFPWTPI